MFRPFAIVRSICSTQPANSDLYQFMDCTYPEDSADWINFGFIGLGAVAHVILRGWEPHNLHRTYASDDLFLRASVAILKAFIAMILEVVPFIASTSINAPELEVKGEYSAKVYHYFISCNGADSTSASVNSALLRPNGEAEVALCGWSCQANSQSAQIWLFSHSLAMEG